MLPCCLVTILAYVLVLSGDHTLLPRRKATHDTPQLIFVLRSRVVDQILIEWRPLPTQLLEWREVIALAALTCGVVAMGRFVEQRRE